MKRGVGITWEVEVGREAGPGSPVTGERWIRGHLLPGAEPAVVELFDQVSQAAFELFQAFYAKTRRDMPPQRSELN